jgi:hypothetical protein
VNDIVIIFRSSKASDVKRLVQRLNARFELRDMSELKFFLDVRIIRDDRDIYLYQDSYMNKLTIEYLIDAFKTPSFSLPSNFIASSSVHSTVNSKSNSNPNSISSNSSIVNFFLRKKYRKKVDSICYSANITRSDVAKATFKLAEHLINLEPEHLHAINHCLQYLYETKYLAIKYFLSRGDELTIQSFDDHDHDQTLSTKNKHVFENTIDVSFANSLERRSYERFTFKLYDDMID